MSSAINIMQERVTRSRVAGDPPEIEIVPDVQDIGLTDFHRAALTVARSQPETVLASGAPVHESEAAGRP